MSENSNVPTLVITSLKAFKKLSKIRAEKEGILLHEAQKQIAREAKFDDVNDAIRKLKAQDEKARSKEGAAGKKAATPPAPVGSNDKAGTRDSQMKKDILNIASLYYGASISKIKDWSRRPHPLLGGKNPDEMVKSGQVDKLLQFARKTMAEPWNARYKEGYEGADDESRIDPTPRFNAFLFEGLQDSVLFLRVQAGSHRHKAIEEALHIAKREELTVKFDFNGIPCSVTPRDTEEGLLAYFETAVEERRAAYEASEDYKVSIVERAARNVEQQRLVDALMARLPAEVGTEKSLVAWLKEYTDVADDNGINNHSTEVILSITKAGWVRGDCVGHPEVERNKNIFARWLIGQALDGMHIVGAPHPGLGRFAERYDSIG